MKTEILQDQPQAEIFRQEYLDVLAKNPLVDDLPELCQVVPGEDRRSYIDRVSESQEYFGAGTYLLDPTFGSEDAQDDAVPLRFDKMVPESSVDTRGSLSRDGFFAHEFYSPETDERFSLAFRPHNPESSDSVLDDFARNMFAKHLGLDNTQTLGFYLTGDGGGGTISLLDKSIRSLDKLSIDSMTEGDCSSSVLGHVAKELAFLHSKGVAHGDVALRNIVIPTSLEGGQPYLIDWGRSEVADGDTKIPDTNTALHDVRSLHMDFVELIQQDDYTREELQELFTEHFYEPYINWRNAFFDSQGKRDRTQTRQELMSELRELFDNS